MAGTSYEEVLAIVKQEVTLIMKKLRAFLFLLLLFVIGIIVGARYVALPLCGGL